MRRAFFVTMGIVMMIVGALWAIDVFASNPYFVNDAISIMLTQGKIFSWGNVHLIVQIFGWWLLLFGGMLLLHRER